MQGFVALGFELFMFRKAEDVASSKHVSRQKVGLYIPYKCQLLLFLSILVSFPKSLLACSAYERHEANQVLNPQHLNPGPLNPKA